MNECCDLTGGMLEVQPKEKAENQVRSKRMKNAIKKIFRLLGYDLRKIPSVQPGIPDATLYRPLFSPWLAPGFQRYYELAARHSLVSSDRCYVLDRLTRHAFHLPGHFWECGVYKGGTASLLVALLREQASAKKLHLFDTFEGMPQTDAEKDLHEKGDFSDTSLAEVQAHVDGGEIATFHPGFIPDTFVGLESELIAFAHIDVDIYKSVIDCLDFIYPRLSPGGVIVVDDYGFPSCPGARRAVDDFFAVRPEVPLCLTTGQAIVFRHSQKDWANS
jgi:O-methyltransferase